MKGVLSAVIALGVGIWIGIKYGDKIEEGCSKAKSFTQEKLKEFTEKKEEEAEPVEPAEGEAQEEA
jgi:hypothetical protein